MPWSKSQQYKKKSFQNVAKLRKYFIKFWCQRLFIATKTFTKEKKKKHTHSGGTLLTSFKLFLAKRSSEKFSEDPLKILFFSEDLRETICKKFKVFHHCVSLAPFLVEHCFRLRALLCEEKSFDCFWPLLHRLFTLWFCHQVDDCEVKYSYCDLVRFQTKLAPTLSFPLLNWLQFEMNYERMIWSFRDRSFFYCFLFLWVWCKDDTAWPRCNVSGAPNRHFLGLQYSCHVQCSWRRFSEVSVREVTMEHGVYIGIGANMLVA